MAFKIGGSIGKLANQVKKMNAKDLGAAVLTGGLSTQVSAITGKNAEGLTKGLSTNMGTQVEAANPTGYLAASESKLNPIADQYAQYAAQNQITSNVDPAFRNYQLGLAQQLQQQANGQGPSIAQAQLQQATDRTLNQSLGAIRSATGANAGLAARSAALAGAQGLGSAANQSSQLRLQEQQAAQQQLASVAGAGRTGDINVNSQNMTAQQANAQNALAGLQGRQDIANTQIGAQGNVLGYQNQATQQTSQNKNNRTNAILGGLFNGAATAFGGGG